MSTTKRRPNAEPWRDATWGTLQRNRWLSEQFPHDPAWDRLIRRSLKAAEADENRLRECRTSDAWVPNERVALLTERLRIERAPDVRARITDAIARARASPRPWMPDRSWAHESAPEFRARQMIEWLQSARVIVGDARVHPEARERVATKIGEVWSKLNGRDIAIRNRLAFLDALEQLTRPSPAMLFERGFLAVPPSRATPAHVESARRRHALQMADPRDAFMLALADAPEIPFERLLFVDLEPLRCALEAWPDSSGGRNKSKSRSVLALWEHLSGERLTWPALLRLWQRHRKATKRGAKK